MIFKKISYLIMFVIMSTAVFSQGGTTASMNGIIKDLDGKPLIGATVKIKHLPTGTTSGIISQKNGRFNIIGLKVGGPYEITVSMVGFSTNTYDNIYLTINQNFALDVVLKEKDYKLAQVDVVAKKSDVISSDRTGAASTVSESTIRSFPSISRSIGDYARLSPQVIGDAGGSNVAGRNSKYNNIQVDGAVMNDVFGLPSNGTPGGQAGAQPFSLDAIQEFQVSIAPYDVKYGGFTGGLINAITRSGSNKFTGSVYSFYNSESLVGKSTDGLDKPWAEYNDYTIGARVGGPIIENELFYFVNAEIKNKSIPTTNSFDKAATNYAGVSEAELIRVDSIASQKWGLTNRGGYAPDFTGITKDIKIFARLDYNINDFNRLTLRHNYVDALQDNNIFRGGSTYEFTSMLYQFASTQNQTVLQLNSIIDNGIFNEFRAAYTTLRDKRDPSVAPMPGIKINGVGDGTKSIWLGVERSSQQNSLNQDIIEITDNLSYQLGDHLLTLGTNNQFFSFDNLFIQDYYGYYEFSNIENFLKGQWSRYRNSYSLLADNKTPSAKWNMSQHAFYLQDEYSVMDGLKIYAGIRAELSYFPDAPLSNPYFNDSVKVFKDAGYNTSTVPDGMMLISPRIGFNYDVYNDKTTQIRGGIGVFTGRTPGVWLSNQYSNTGMDFARINTSSYNANTPFTADPFKQPKLTGAATTSIAFTDKDFKMPSLIKTNIGIDQTLFHGFILTLEGLYQKTQNDIFFQNVNLVDSTGTDIYGRFMFKKAQVSSKYTPGAIRMTNTNLGDQTLISVQLQKPYGQGILPSLSANISYTWSRIRDVNSTGSSVAYSNWSFNYADNPNNPSLTTSNFDIPHRIMANISYTYEYLSGFATTLGIYYEGRSGSPYTLVYTTNTDVNNDGSTGNDIAYIPKADGEINFLTTTDGLDPVTKKQLGTYNDFVEFINKLDGIDDVKGKIMERNSLRSPFYSQFDFRVAQEIPTFNGQKLELTLDVFNALSLEYEYVNFQNYALFRHVNYDNTGTQTVAFLKPTSTTSVFSKSDFLSRWRMQLGVRYSF